MFLLIYRFSKHEIFSTMPAEMYFGQEEKTPNPSLLTYNYFAFGNVLLVLGFV